ncbi:unnamed protein product [Ceratitis capitata]|uniref:(Mediterranean fruit fly) hypothetical protein n=1 Tax=Ceratitis capitata TaxID=7213 RepID=A0A811VJ58_CERCA|nr:unnamed protein product [Ceratitis capitata]
MDERPNKMKAIILYAGLICALCLFRTLSAAPADTTTPLEDERDQLAVLEQEPTILELSRQTRAIAIF